MIPAEMAVEPVDRDGPRGPRPRWSVMIPTYNCAGYLRQTLESVLQQDPGADRMQIEVVDDCSTADDPAAVVAEIAPGRVTFFRQPRNLGHVATFNTCLRRARGELIHLLHGDDMVLSGFYSRLQEVLDTRADVGAAFCRHGLIDEEGALRYLFPSEQDLAGVLPDWLEKIAVRQRIVPGAIVVRRAVYERLGGFDPRIEWSGEDWEMWVRIAAAYPVWYEPGVLAMYRARASSLTGRSVRTGDNLRGAGTTIRLFARHLPPTRAGELAARARAWVAVQAIKQARRALFVGDATAAGAQLRGALRLSRSGPVLAELASFAVWFGTRPVRRALAAGARRVGFRRNPRPTAMGGGNGPTLVESARQDTKSRSTGRELPS